MRALTAAVVAVGAFALFGGSVAQADTLEIVGTTHVLKRGTEVIKTYTAQEWRAWTNELDGLSQALGTESGFSTLPSVETLTTGGRGAIETVVETARSKGVELPAPEVAGDDALAEAAGGVTEVGGASVLGAFALGAGAFYVGIRVGDELDSLFGLPSFDQGEAETHASSGGAPCELRHGEVSVNYASEGGGSFHGPKAWYVQCNGHPGNGETQAGEWTKGVHEGTGWCTTACTFGPYNPLLESYTVVTNSRTGCFGECHEFGTETFTWDPEECGPNEILPGSSELKLTAWLDHGSASSDACPPATVPFAAPLTGTQKSVNEAHGLSPEPIAPELPARPMVPEILPPERIETFTTDAPAREKVETTETPKKLEEEEAEKEEEEELPIFIPVPAPHEHGTDYAKKAEEHGFHNVHLRTLPAEYTDPLKGPSEVTSVAPSPGTDAKPNVDLEVQQNPEDAPSPIVGGGIGAPTLPGIKLPKLGVLCTNFPFGVPCWIVSEFTLFSAASTTPEWTVGPFTVQGKKIGPATVNLAFLSPIMEIVRPFMVLFATIGLVLVFYRWATGKNVGTSGEPEVEPEREESDA